jgi:hypothetical protein
LEVCLKLVKFTLVRQVSTILLLATLLLSQYGKFFAYVECRFTNLLLANGTSCECEKDIPLPFRAEARELPPRTFNLSMDEYVIPQSLLNIAALTKRNTYKPSPLADHYAYTWSGNIFRPPRA